MHQSKYQAPPSFDHILGEEAYYFSINLNIISLFEATRLSTVTGLENPWSFTSQDMYQELSIVNDMKKLTWDVHVDATLEPHGE